MCIYVHKAYSVSLYYHIIRISNALSGASENSELFKASLAKSLILSVDMAHAIHPNYASKHEKNHAPRMNSGIVIKTNSNQRYATNGITGLLVFSFAYRETIAQLIIYNEMYMYVYLCALIATCINLRIYMNIYKFIYINVCVYLYKYMPDTFHWRRIQTIIM